MTTSPRTSYEGKHGVLRERHDGGAIVLIYREGSQEVFLRRGHLNGPEGQERVSQVDMCGGNFLREWVASNMCRR